tara:strand:- start:386 stop:1024 length:639 start_codon:yes stop_codon:yes gene_type:complete
MRGRFLVLEGIDGCGKTTQIKHLSNWLPNSGLMPKDSILHVTREPGGTYIGKELRHLLLNTSKENTPKDLTELLLYAADRAQHVSEVIKPEIEKGNWVLSDRFSGSTLAYQGYGRNLNIDLIKQLEKIATQKISPDVTLFLEISVKESIKRRNETANDRIEAEGEEFLQRVTLGFSQLAKERNWITIPSEEAKNFVSQNIENQLKEFLKNCS